MTIEHRTCQKNTKRDISISRYCGRNLPLECFYKNKYQCIDCVKRRNKERRKENSLKKNIIRMIIKTNDDIIFRKIFLSTLNDYEDKHKEKILFLTEEIKKFQEYITLLKCLI